MATVSELTIAKGAYSVIVYTDSISDTLKNKLLLINLAQSSQLQNTGPAGTLVVDLLRITRTFLIKGHIISNAVKSDLINIVGGGGVTGGTTTLTYDSGGDATSFEGFIESCLITQESADEPTSEPNDFAKFVVTITFVEGTQMSGT